MESDRQFKMNLETEDKKEDEKIQDSEQKMIITDSVKTSTINATAAPLLSNIKSTSLSQIINNSGINTANTIKKREYAKVIVPINRLKPLRESWTTIVKVLVEHMKIDIKFNSKRRCVDIRTNEKTEDSCALRKSEDFLKAFMYGFDLQDAIAMLRLEDLYLETFLVKDVKASLHGDHLSRAIGRICGEKGKTKNAIENSTQTRIVIQGQKIHILGSYVSTQFARNSLCALILGAPQGKVYSKLRVIGKKIKEI